MNAMAYAKRFTPAEHLDAILEAQEAGYFVVQGTDNLLLLDLDNQGAVDGFGVAFSRMLQLRPARILFQGASRSARPDRQHVVIWLFNPEPNVRARIALQASLGSDPAREQMALELVDNGVLRPSLLFVKPETANHIEAEVKAIGEELGTVIAAAEIFTPPKPAAEPERLSTEPF